jgi:hypothetical protein
VNEPEALGCLFVDRRRSLTLYRQARPLQIV